MSLSSSSADSRLSSVWKDIANPSYSALCMPYTGAACLTYSSARDSVRSEYCGFCSAPSASVAFGFARPRLRPAAAPAAPPAAPPHLHAQFASVGLEASHDIDELDFNDWLEAVFKKFDTDNSGMCACRNTP